MALQDFEKLGSFYLGKAYDVDARTRQEDLVLYDSKDLVTHAVCVGMTGSGKTGLCIGLLEEAAIDGIPAIVIDPKGDLANMLLTFPDLKASDFRPWINEDDARKKGVEPDAFAQQQADLWAKGLAAWGQDGDRIRRLRSSAEFVVYTPGSNAGKQISVLKSFACPGDAVMDDPELLRERIASTTTSLLGLMGIQADPIQSREHILISTILHRAWGEGRDLDLAALIHDIQQPPFAKLGVMELESVYPAKERFGLAMALNNLVASPGFAAWMEGEPLDVQGMLFNAQGKPRISIVSIAHLSEAERMFFVSLLLNQTLGWVRTQSGTTSLRAIIYMDEIAGYFPPVANPPSKGPLLTLMKQARAFGVGVVLATQNPVDLDYKGLANAGTWFIGRLQTERDKARVLDGLEGAMTGAGAGFDRARIDAMLSGLGPRVFLMNNVHEDAPVVFETRWCMSYLRGPLTRSQLRTLAVTAKSAPVQTPSTASAPAAAPTRRAAATPATTSARPVLPPEIPQYFLGIRKSGVAEVEYAPRVLAIGKVFYSDTKAGVDTEISASMLASIESGPVSVDWEHGEPVELTEDDVERTGVDSASYAALPTDAVKAKSFESWKKSYIDAIFRTHRLELMRSATLRLVSAPGETERDFRARLIQIAREQRDGQAEKLRQKYAPRLATLHERIRKAEQAVEVQREQASASKMGTALSFGTAILGAFLGRKAVSSANVGRAASAAKSVGRTSKEARDVDRAIDNVESLRNQLADIENEFNAELGEISADAAVSAEPLEQVVLKPKKANINVKTVLLLWTPRSGGEDIWRS
jgi:hypothetical protein